MPNYTLKNRNSLEVIEKTMSIKEMDDFLSANPDFFVVIKPIGQRDNFVSSARTNIPLSNDLKGIFDKIKANNPGNTMDY